MLNRPLNPNTFPSVQDAAGSQYVETVYDGDEPYGDRIGGVWSRSFAAGLARIEPFDPANPPTGGDNTEYFHGDHLGTTRGMSDPNGDAIDYNGSMVSGVDTVYTAFGERVVNTFADGGSDRYGYVGAHGYQSHDPDEMPFLHVGARYYDPGSGRFLQRDPIGIFGGTNVYAYGSNGPTISVDPDGLSAASSDMGRFWGYLARGRIKDAEAILDSLAQLEGKTNAVRRMQQALRAAKAGQKWFKQWTKRGGKTRKQREEMLDTLRDTLKKHVEKYKDHPDSKEIAELEWKIRVLEEALKCGG